MWIFFHIFENTVFEKKNQIYNRETINLITRLIFWVCYDILLRKLGDACFSKFQKKILKSKKIEKIRIDSEKWINSFWKKEDMLRIYYYYFSIC